MNNTLFYECFSGISGDMNLGAMIDLGVEKDYLTDELKKLNLDGWELMVEKDQRHGITGTKVTVLLTREDKKHRHLKDIREIIEGSNLSDKVKDTAIQIFIKVAEAEAKVHDMPVEKVHFHEVGAMDSIIDITGAAICFNRLNVGEVIVSPVELGSGMVRCAHGLLPVPAPATAEILKGIPVSKGNVDFEATTPTGAAIISSLGTKFESSINFRIRKTGYGIGHKENPSLPNLLRVYLGDMTEEGQKGHNASLVECNIDDMNPEMYDNLIDKLFEAGAADVFLENIIMKKTRPGIKVSVICQKGDTGNIKNVLFSESTTLGVRESVFAKSTAGRESKKVNTPYGPVTVKYAYHNGMLVSSKPEIADCQHIARQKGLPLPEVYNTILTAINAGRQ